LQTLTAQIRHTVGEKQKVLAHGCVGDHQTATNSNHVAVMVATTLGRLMVLKDTLSPYFATVVDHTIF